MPFENSTPNRDSGRDHISFLNPATFPNNSAQVTNHQPQDNEGRSYQGYGNYDVNQPHLAWNSSNANRFQNWDTFNEHSHISGNYQDNCYSENSRVYQGQIIESGNNQNDGCHAGNLNKIQIMNKLDPWQWGDTDDALNWEDGDGAVDPGKQYINPSVHNEKDTCEQDFYRSDHLRNTVENNGNCDIQKNICDSVDNSSLKFDSIQRLEANTKNYNKEAVDGCEIRVSNDLINVPGHIYVGEEDLISDGVLADNAEDVSEQPSSAWSNASVTSCTSYNQRVQSLEEEITLQSKKVAAVVSENQCGNKEDGRLLLGAESDINSINSLQNMEGLVDLNSRLAGSGDNHQYEHGNYSGEVNHNENMEEKRRVQGEHSNPCEGDFPGTRDGFLQSDAVLRAGDSHESGDGAFDHDQNFHPMSGYYQSPPSTSLEFAGDGEASEDRIVPGIASDCHTFSRSVPPLMTPSVNNICQAPNVPMRNTPPVRKETMGGSDMERDNNNGSTDDILCLDPPHSDSAVPCSNGQRVGNDDVDAKGIQQEGLETQIGRTRETDYPHSVDERGSKKCFDTLRNGDGVGNDLNGEGYKGHGASNWAQDNFIGELDRQSIDSNYSRDGGHRKDRRSSSHGAEKKDPNHMRERLDSSHRRGSDHGRDSDLGRPKTESDYGRKPNSSRRDDISKKEVHGRDECLAGDMRQRGSYEEDSPYIRDNNVKKGINNGSDPSLAKDVSIKDNVEVDVSQNQRNFNVNPMRVNPRETRYMEGEEGCEQRDYYDRRGEYSYMSRHDSSDRLSDAMRKHENKLYRGNDSDRKGSSRHGDLDKREGAYDRRNDNYSRNPYDQGEDYESHSDKYGSHYDASYRDRGHRGDGMRKRESRSDHRYEYDTKSDNYYSKRYENDKNGPWQQLPHRPGGDGYYDPGHRNSRNETFETYRDGDRRRDHRIKDGDYYRGYDDESYRDDRSRPVSRSGSTYDDPYHYRDPRGLPDYDRYRAYRREPGYDYYKRGAYPYYDPYQYYLDYYRRMTQNQFEGLKRTNPQAYNDWCKKYYGHGYSEVARTQHKSGRSSVNDESEKSQTTSDPARVIERVEQSFQVINQETQPNSESSHYYNGNPENGYDYSGYNYSIAQPSVAEAEEVSALATHRMTPAKFISPHIIAHFTPNGKILKVLSHNPLEGRAAQVEIMDLQDILGDSPDLQNLQVYPGPLLRGETHKNNVIQFINDKLKSIRENMEIVDGDSASLLWEYLLLSVRQNGTVVGSDVAELLLNRQNNLHRASRQGSLCGSEGETHLAHTDKHNRTLVQHHNEIEGDVVTKFQEYLLYGHKKKALDWAMQQGLWGHALFLSSKMDGRTHASVMAKFTSVLPSTDPLQTLYQLMSGRQPASVTCCPENKWGDWHPHLAMILSNPIFQTDVDQKAIITLGDTLASKGLLHAAQFCYLMAKVQFGQFSVKSSKLVLLGSSPSLPFEQFATDEAIQCTEVYEYSQALANSDFVLPNLQGYKLIYANRLLDNGLLQDALRYCEVISYAICGCPSAYNRNLVAQVSELSNKLKYHDPYYTGGEGDISDMEDPPWLISLRTVQQEVTITYPKEDNEPSMTYLESDDTNMGITHPLIFNLNSGQIGMTTSGIPSDPGNQGVTSEVPTPAQPWSLPQNSIYSDYQASTQDYNSLQANNAYLLNAGDEQNQNQGQDQTFNYWDSSPPSYGQHQQFPEEQYHDNTYSGNQQEETNQPLPESTINDSAENKLQKTNEDKEDKRQKGGGWFGGIMNKLTFKPKNQMILPDDKNPAIVWDDEKKCWKNTGSEEESPPGPVAPPKDFELSPTDPHTPPFPLSSMSSSGGNRFKLQKGRGVKQSYVDVLNPNKTPTTSTPKYPDVVQPAFMNQSAFPSPPQDPSYVDQYQDNAPGDDQNTEQAHTPMMMNPSNFAGPNLSVAKQKRLYPR